MRFAIAVAVALAFTSSASGQTIPDLSTATPIAGSWSYAPATDGSEAVFADGSGYPQLWIHCTRATRQVSIARTAGMATAMLNVWTGSMTRSAAASFDPAKARLTVTLTNYNPLLDALANSRGRLGFALGSEPALVVPAWPEVARIIEDCRS